MPEYSLEFSRKLIKSAKHLIYNGVEEIDSQRAILYLSCLSCEITLKALLEKVGIPIKDIITYQHRLNDLLTEVGKCEIEVNVTEGKKAWIPAVQLRSITVDEAYSNATVGTFLSAEEKGASKYPNQVRYGYNLKNYPAHLWVKTATSLYEWAINNWGNARKKNNALPKGEPDC